MNHPLATTPSADPLLLSTEEAAAIARQAYVYAYPAVLMALTRQSYLARPGSAINAFLHRREFHDAAFTAVVRPNADTLYSVMWFDLSTESLLMRVPSSQGRYYLLQMLDQWSDTFAVPGSRTTGNGEQLIALTGPDWADELPADVLQVRSPTRSGWIIGRMQTSATTADLAAVHAFQDGMRVSALPSSGPTRARMPALVLPQPPEPHTPPVAHIEGLDARRYFGLFAELLQTQSPHGNDYPLLHRIARLGLVPGRPLAWDALPAPHRAALDGAAAAALPFIRHKGETLGTEVNGWRTQLGAIGTYGTDYLARAAVACMALGANPVEDATYPFAFKDSEGRPLDAAHRYVLRFRHDQRPPVRAFWSLTMYDQRQLFVANPLRRYTLGSRDALAVNADDSLDIHIQRDAPSTTPLSNWLPAPHSGPFTMNLRLYWPDDTALDGRWTPPAVVRLS